MPTEVILHPWFEPLEVIASVVMAIVASYAALTLSALVGTRKGTARLPWLLCGGLAVGLGIAGMHFVGMLAMRLSVPVAYDATLTAVSFVVAAIASTAALSLTTGATLRVRRMVLASVSLGIAIAGMHYVGMSAMRGHFDMTYDLGRVTASVIIAIAVAAMAFGLAHRLRNASGIRGVIYQLASATLMGGSVAGMHYTAMSAVVFSARSGSPGEGLGGIAGRELSSLVTIISLVILLGSILVALVAQKARRTAREAALTNMRYRQMAEAMPQIVWTARRDGSIEYFNRQWFEYTGKQAGETSMSQWLAVIHPDDTAECLRQWITAADKGQPYDAEYRLKRADGQYRWHVSRAVPLHDAGGSLVTWFGTCTDIDDRKSAEAQLRDHQLTLEHRIHEREAEAERAMALYQLLAENATDMVSTHRPDGTFEYATPSWVEYLGVNPSGEFPAAFSHPDDIPVLMANHKLGFRSSKPLTTVWRCRRTDGSYGWVETRTRAVFHPATRRVLTFVCATHDVSERKRQEQELESLHRTVLAVSGATSLDDALGLALRELCTATGWSYAEAWLPSSDGTCIERSPVWYGREGAGAEAIALASAGLTQKAGEGIPGRAWQSGEVVWVRDTSTDSRTTRSVLAIEAGFGAGVAVPVVAEGVVVAVLAFMMSVSVPGDEAQVAFVSVVAAQLGALIARNRVAQSLANERRFLEALLDSLGDGIIAVDAAGRMRSNRAARETHGEMDPLLDPHDASRRYNLFRLDGVTHLAPDELPLMRVMKGEKVRDQEYVIGARNLGLRTLSASGTQIVDDYGKQLGAVLAIRDVTQTKRDELALRESEAKYRLLVEQAADAILLVDADGRCAGANMRAGLLMGVHPSALLGRRVKSFMIPVSPEAPCAPAPLVDGVSTAEFRIRRDDGGLIHIEASTATLADGRVQIIARDIRSRKELERLKDEFISVVSHELRTPLTSIRGSLGLLASGQLASAPEKGQRMLSVAVTNTDRLIRLINDILDVERIDSGSVTMELEWCDGREIADHVVEALKPVADRAGVAVSVKGGGVRLWADADRITQTITNLVGNAIKFSPEGATVDVVVESGITSATFEVRDRGRGIPPEKLETIFERFQQVDASDAREKGGTGLGLAISRGIIRQHGGRIWAENNPGGGSVFKFTLPRPADAEPLAASGKNVVRERPIRILVIEDDVELAQVIATALEARGFAVVVAHDGATAIDLHAIAGADVLIVDLNLPDMMGLDVVDHIRGGLGGSGSRTIVYTAADPTPVARERIRGMGAELATKGRVSTEALVERVIRGLEAAPVNLSSAV